MDVMFTAHIELFSRIFHARIDFRDWALSLSPSRSGAAITLSIGPVHFGYSNLLKLQKYFETLIDESLPDEFDFSGDTREAGQSTETSEEERVVH
mgnify:FL=1